MFKVGQWVKRIPEHNNGFWKTNYKGTLEPVKITDIRNGLIYLNGNTTNGTQEHKFTSCDRFDRIIEEMKDA
jgi:hypothetical protein